MKNLIILFSVLFPAFLTSQDGFKPGKIDPSFVKMEKCPFDSTARAYYILNYGETSIAHTMEVEFKNVVQLKIISKSEFDKADISIPYANGKSVLALKAYTYNMENGKMVATKVDKDGVFKEKVNDNYSKLNITFPNVKEGSVIEYSYRVNYGNYDRLNTWYFQTSLPVLRSEYHVVLPAYFDYQRLMTGYVSLQKATIDQENGYFGSNSVMNLHHTYVGLNVPAFEDEPYMISKDDAISKIDFELRSVVIPGQYSRNYLPGSFGELVGKMLESEYWSKDINNAPFAKDVLESMLEGVETPREKAELIYEYIKNFKKSSSSASSLRSAFKDQEGSDFDLNRLLVAMLREVGISADPVRISTRSHGRVNQFVPMYRSFNFVIVKASLGDETLLLDASEKEHVFGVLPKYCINGSGLVIKPGPEEWVDLNPYSDNGKIVQATLELTEDAILVGDLIVRRKGYEAWEFDEELKDDGKEKYKEDFEKNKDNWLIEEHEIDDMDDPFSNQETISLELEGQVEDIGDLIYLNPVVLGQWKENPFKTVDRKFPVSYGATVSDTYLCEITIPEGMEVETLPEAISMALPNDGGTISYQVRQLGNRISINQRLRINKTDFSSEEYPYLREFYARIVAKQGEQIVLKRL